MEVIKTAIDGVLIIEPKVFGDKRGYFFESFSQRDVPKRPRPTIRKVFLLTVIFYSSEVCSLSVISVYEFQDTLPAVPSRKKGSKQKTKVYPLCPKT